MNYTKLSFKAKAKDFKYPFFIGSQLRGAFGYALKKVVCINPSYRCEGCFATKECLYYDFYELKNTFHKFRFDFGLNLTNLEFSIYLFDDKCEEMPYILSAIIKLLKEIGLGQDRKKFEIYEVMCNDKSILNGEDFDLSNCNNLNLEVKGYHKDIKLKFLTPLRIKENNKFARNDIKLETILKSIKYRLSELENSNNRRLGFEPNYKIKSKNINFKDFNRYSNRQKNSMNIGGIIGEIVYNDLDKNSYELLKIGEIIGVGKSTVFGLGKIKIEDNYEK